MASTGTEADCIFCKIIAGEIPANRVYEDEHHVGFLDIRPRAPGHTLLIPKKHHRWVWDISDLPAFFLAAQHVVDALRKAFQTEMIFGHVMGDEVPHAHLWLVPENGTGAGWSREKIAGEIKRFL